jgi:hypothetical protein
MREKVDKFNIDELIRKFDQKIVNEVARKLDFSDLKRNNNMINKKIDTLENKISRTLVDTLIDLQLEEAPLIIKQGMKGEKCASCNQNINHQHGEMFGDKFSTTNTIKKMVYNEKSKREENPLMKSASSMVNMNYNPEMNTIINNNSNNLSTINSKITVTDRKLKTFSMDKTSTFKKGRNFNKTVSSSLTMRANENEPDKIYNNIINEELGKLVVKPENIMRASNKVYENLDKK